MEDKTKKRFAKVFKSKLSNMDTYNVVFDMKKFLINYHCGKEMVNREEMFALYKQEMYDRQMGKEFEAINEEKMFLASYYLTRKPNRKIKKK